MGTPSLGIFSVKFKVKRPMVSENMNEVEPWLRVPDSMGCVWSRQSCKSTIYCNYLGEDVEFVAAEMGVAVRNEMIAFVDITEDAGQAMKL